MSASDLGMTFGGTKTLYVEAVKGHTSNQMITVATDVVGTAWSGTVSDNVRVTPIGFKIKSVSFDSFSSGEIYPITKDDGSIVYNTLHWLDDNLDGDVADTGDHYYPVAYKRQAAMVLERKFELVAPSSFSAAGTDLVVRGQGDGGYEFWSGSNDTSGSDPKHTFVKGTTLLTTRDTASQAFPNWIDHFDPMTIKWSFSTDAGTNWNSVGDTKHKIYTFLDAPQDILYETVAKIATAGPVKGLSTPAAVVDAIWTEFADNDVRRVDGVQMSYSHATGPGNVALFGYTAPEMLARGDGRGQCTAWADLLLRTLGAHNIESTSTKVDPPDTRFAVKAMPAQGSGGANYLVGTLAAGGFNFHQVLRVALFPDRIYDPSYGGLTTKSDARSVELKYEDENITHFRFGASTWVANVLGDALQLEFTP